MPIIKDRLMQGGIYSHHEVAKVSVAHTPSGVRYVVHMSSFIDVADKETSQGANWSIVIHNATSDVRVLTALEDEILMQPELLGGTRVGMPEPISSLAYSQAKKWLQIKAAKSAEMTSPLTTPYGVFDCDAESEKRITGAIMLLQTLEGMGTPTTVDFVLADNSVVTLTTSQMVEVGLIMGARVQAAISKASNLRTAIEAAIDVEAVEAITW